MTLTKAQREQFSEEGYVVIRSALTDADLSPVIHDYEQVIDRLARELYAEGRIRQLYLDEPFETRLARICDDDETMYFESDTFLDVGHVRGKGTFEFMRNRRLLDLVAGIIGPEICCSPMTHIRAKLPSDLERGKNTHVASGHQDAIFLHEEADETFFLTVWLPVCDATPENGCLRVVPKIHKRRVVYWGNSLSNEEGLDVPMKKGDVIFIHKLTPHSSGPNRTNAIRWSMDVRYQRIGTPTGRAFWPSFIARSHTSQKSETDYEDWRRQWLTALEKYPKKVPRKNQPEGPMPYRGEM